MSPAVGIDDMHVYGSTLCVAADTITRGRATADRPAPDLQRLELRTRSLPPPWEDPVTLAVQAARPLVQGREAEIGLCLVATESGIDDAKPLSAYVHHWLGLPERCRHAELKHACYGGTVALNLAADWVRADPKRVALVITTDMARRLFEDPAEAAEGAGAVAMRVTANPRVLAFGTHRGVAAREIYDVMRPTRTAEVIHATRSLAAYLDLLESAYEHFTEQAGDPWPDLHHMLYHTPLIPLIVQAHDLIAPLPTDTLDPSFDRLVRPSLAFGQALGNTYSGSLYAALACLAHGTSVSEPARIGLYSYGSGSCAEFYDAWLQPTAQATVARHHIAEALAARRPVDLPTYEAIVRAHEASLSQPTFEPDLTLPPGLFDAAYDGASRLVLTAVRDHYRSYRWS